MKSPKTNTTFKKLAAALVATTVLGGGVAAFNGAAVGPATADAVKIEKPAVAPGFADIVEKVSPAVVSVRVKSDVQPASSTEFNFNGENLDQLPPPLQRFFRQFGPDMGQGFGNDNQQGRGHGNQQRHFNHARPVAQGSGFFISSDGYLVTNNHVVADGDQYSVLMDDGTELDAKLVGTDPRTDLAVLKVEDSRDFTYVQFADDSSVRVGDWVVAVGNPFGLGGTVTAGIVSAMGRNIGAGPYDDFIQIDAAVNRGNSGGPTFNLEGKVVGINTAIFSPSGGNVGIAFDVPSSTANKIVHELIKNGSIQRGWLGVSIQPVTKDIAESMGIEKTDGALVAQPQDGTPAKKAGIQSGDIITQVDGKDIKDPRDLAKVIANYNPGSKVDITLLRNGKQKDLSLTLGEMPNDEMASAAPDQQPQQKSETALSDFGITVAPADQGEGVVVTDVLPNSVAADAGIKAGQKILEVNNQKVASASDVSKQMDEVAQSGRKAALFLMEQDNANRFVAVPVAKG